MTRVALVGAFAEHAVADLQLRAEQLRAAGDLQRAAAVEAARKGLRKRLAALELQERTAAEQTARAAAVGPAATPADLELELPIRTVNESNQRDHWSQKHRDRGGIRPTVKLQVQQHVKVRGLSLRPPCSVLLVRLAPGTLDTDGVVSALKAVRDGVADALGSDDSARAGIRWVYDQARAPYYAIRIEIRRDAA